MRQLTLNPKDFIVKHDGETHKGRFTELPNFCWDHVKVDSKVTVRDVLLKMIKPNLEFWTQATGEHYLPDLVAYAQKHRPSKKRGTFKKIVVGWWLSSEKYDNGRVRVVRKKDKIVFKHTKPKKIKITKLCSFSTDVIGIVGRKEYGLDFSPPEDYLGATFKLDTKLNLHREDYTHEAEKPFGDMEYLGTLDFTLIEFFRAIFYEFTFYGTPENTKEKSDDLKQRCDDAKSDKENLIKVEFE